MKQKAMVIDNFYRIEYDSFNCILVFEKETDKVNDKSGKKEVARRKWYHSNIRQCLMTYINEELKVSGEIKDVLDKLDSLESLIKNICND